MLSVRQPSMQNSQGLQTLTILVQTKAENKTGSRSGQIRAPQCLSKKGGARSASAPQTLSVNADPDLEAFLRPLLLIIHKHLRTWVGCRRRGGGVLCWVPLVLPLS